MNSVRVRLSHNYMAQLRRVDTHFCALREYTELTDCVCAQIGKPFFGPRQLKVAEMDGPAGAKKT